MIVGLAGFAGAGKDEAGKALVADGWERRAFADPIKEVAIRIGWDGNKDDAGRRLIQNLGMACREVLGDYAWVNATLRDAEDRDIVVTDVRFPIEAEAIANAGGRTVLVERPGVGPVNEHVSEHALRDWEHDAVIVNDGTIEQLCAAVRQTVDRLRAEETDKGRWT